MKSYKHLFDEVVSFRNLSRAYRKARRGKRDKPEVIRFDLRQEEEIICLEQELRSGAYRPGGQDARPLAGKRLQRKCLSGLLP